MAGGTTILNLKFWEYTAFSALLLEIGGIAVYGGAHSAYSLALAFKAASVLFLLGLAATSAGGLLGFLFGVPKYRTDSAIAGSFQHNSNLEQISDWLTKIIVGATLVQLNNIGLAIGRISSLIGTELNKSGQMASASTAACSVMIFSFFTGFMWGYLWMTVRVRQELDETSTLRAENPSSPYDRLSPP